MFGWVSVEKAVLGCCGPFRVLGCFLFLVVEWFLFAFFGVCFGLVGVLGACGFGGFVARARG